MLAFAYYLLKVIICSAILFGYYWFFLRNKVFHVYNRFYLLAIIIISVGLPLIKFNIFHNDANKPTVIKMLQVVRAGDEYMDEIIIGAPAKANLSFVDSLPFIYAIISAAFLIMLVQMLVTIFNLLKKNEKIYLENFQIINTDGAKGTPFSFFNFIFWNNQIDMNSPSGNKIFKHEIAHVQERHSWDKMFINIILIVFWSNPIFWLIRKELSMIHEFIADKKAVEDGDTSAFAAMILKATYPQKTFYITNSFFYSPIKRRIMMLTKQQHPRMNYISRLLVLPLLLIVFGAFTIKIANKIKDENFIKKAANKIVVVIDAAHGGSDAGAINKDPAINVNSLDISKSKIIYNDTIGYYAGKPVISYRVNPLSNKCTIIFSDKTTKIITLKEAREAKLLAPPPPPPPPIIKTHSKKDLSTGHFIDLDPAGNYNGKAVLMVSRNREESVSIMFVNNEYKTISIEEAQKAGLPIPPSPSKSITDKVFEKKLGKHENLESRANVVGVGEASADDVKLFKKLGHVFIRVEKDGELPYKGPNRLVLRDGEIQYTIHAKIYKGDLMVMLPGKDAIEKYGPTAFGGAVEITSKEQYEKVSGQKVNLNQTISDKVFTKVEVDPEFPGGKDAWRKFLQTNLNGSIAVKEGLKAGNYTFITKFIVHEDGSLSDFTSEKNINDKIAKHCIEVIKKNPKWKPAMQNGHIVAAYKRQPITFVVSEENPTPMNISSRLNPVINIGNLSNPRVRVDDLKKQKIITVTNGYEFVNATVYFSRTGFDKVGVANLKGDNLSNIKEFLNKCDVGTAITFDNISVKNKDGIKFIDGRSFILY